MLKWTGDGCEGQEQQHPGLGGMEPPGVLPPVEGESCISSTQEGLGKGKEVETSVPNSVAESIEVRGQQGSIKSQSRLMLDLTT